MRKSIAKLISTMLVLMLVIASIACLAELRRVRELDGYEQYDEEQHYAVYTIMEGEATEDGGILSGKPVDEVRELEAHEFGDDGVCTKCGYKDSDEIRPVGTPKGIGGDDDGDDDDDTTTTTTTTDTAAEYTTASGVTVAVGTPAAETLKQTFAAIPANTQVTFDGVDKTVADELIKAINEGAAPAEMLAILANFPTQVVDGTPCYVVTISYTDAAGKPVTENYAFSTADGTLVKVF